MRQYHDLLRLVLEQGKPRMDRTGTGTIVGLRRAGAFRFAPRTRFPLLTTKKLHLKSIIYELLWFLRGDTNVRYLNEHGVTIWDEWADEKGDLGRVYGAQWCDWQGADGSHINQIDDVIERLRKESGEPAADRERMESGRDRKDGVAAVSRALPILRAGRRAKLPALPAQRRSCSSACRSTSPPTPCSR